MLRQRAFQMLGDGRAHLVQHIDQLGLAVIRIEGICCGNDRTHAAAGNCRDRDIFPPEHFQHPDMGQSPHPSSAQCQADRRLLSRPALQHGADAFPETAPRSM